MKHWVSKVSKLAWFAKTQPHATQAAFTHGLSSEWTCLSRSVQSLQEHLQPLEDVIHRDLLPSLTGRAVSDLERRLLSLPARHGGMSLCNLVHEARPHFDPLWLLHQWCTTFVALMKTAVTSWRPWATV